MTRPKYKIALTEEAVGKAFAEGRTTAQVAKMFGITSATICRNFPQFVTQRPHHGRGGMYPKEVVDKIRELAKDPDTTVFAARASLGLSCPSIKRICKAYGIKWKSTFRGGHQSKPVLERYPPEMIEIVRAAASDPAITMSAASKTIQRSNSTVRAIAEALGLEWKCKGKGRPRKAHV